MYCKQCGQPVGAQAYCPSCGAPTGLGAPVAAAPAPGFPVSPGYLGSRIASHLRTLGILWIVFPAYLLLRWLLILPFLRGVLGDRMMWMHGSNAWGYGPFHPGGWLIHVITIVVVVRVILSLAAGIALLTRQPWGRIFAIVIAFLTLLKPILGTVLAIYTLWVLLSRNAGPEYDRIVLAGDSAPLYPGAPPPPPIPPMPGTPDPRT